MRTRKQTAAELFFSALPVDNSPIIPYKPHRKKEKSEYRRKLKDILKRRKKLQKRREARRASKKKTPRLRYNEYIDSDAWHRRKLNFFLSHPKRCAICDTFRHIHVHHVSYRNLGHEPDQDLVPLCETHHDQYHRVHGVKQDNVMTWPFIREQRKLIN